MNPGLDSEIFFGGDSDDARSNQASLQDLCDQFTIPLDTGFIDEINEEPNIESDVASKFNIAQFIEVEVSEPLCTNERDGITFNFVEFINRP